MVASVLASEPDEVSMLVEKYSPVSLSPTRISPPFAFPLSAKAEVLNFRAVWWSFLFPQEKRRSIPKSKAVFLRISFISIPFLMLNLLIFIVSWW